MYRHNAPLPATVHDLFIFMYADAFEIVHIFLRLLIPTIKCVILCLFNFILMRYVCLFFRISRHNNTSALILGALIYYQYFMFIVCYVNVFN